MLLHGQNLNIQKVFEKAVINLQKAFRHRKAFLCVKRTEKAEVSANFLHNLVDIIIRLPYNNSINTKEIKE